MILAAALGFALTVIAAAPAQAQQTQAVDSFTQLQVIVRLGDTITITDSTGRKAEGSILTLSPSTLVKYDLEGHYILDIGGGGALPGQFDGVHQIHVDAARNLYVTEVSNDRSQMFRPKPKADPNRIIGPMAIVNAKPPR